MKFRAYQEKYASETIVIAADYSRDPIKVIPPEGSEDKFFDLLIQEHAGIDVWVEDKALEKHLKRSFLESLPEILRGQLPEWRLARVLIALPGCMIWEYDNLTHHGRVQLNYLPKKHTVIAFQCPRSKHGLASTYIVDMLDWLAKPGDSSPLDDPIHITQYVGKTVKQMRISERAIKGRNTLIFDITELSE